MIFPHTGQTRPDPRLNRHALLLLADGSGWTIACGSSHHQPVPDDGPGQVTCKRCLFMKAQR